VAKDRDWRQRIQETIQSRTTTPASTPSGTSTPLLREEDGLEKEALMELLQHVSVQEDKETRVIPLTETEALKRDMSTLPDEATVEEYEATPVQEFGAAMLRGMGWKDGEVAGKRKQYALKEPIAVTARPNLLGLGAKPFPDDLPPKKRKD
jgi:hypothetical protein